MTKAYKTISHRLTMREKLQALAMGFTLFILFWGLAIFMLAM